MQTDLLFKLLNSSLSELKAAIDKFEKHSPPSTSYTEQLYKAITETNKLISAYSVFKEQNEVSPDLNIHLKLMEVEETKVIVNEIQSPKEIEKPIEKVEIISQKAEIKEAEVVPIKEPVIEQPNPTINYNIINDSNLPKLNININDKFRFINELFSSNSNEYNIAIEQLNQSKTLIDATKYFNGLKEIYFWKEDNDLVKTLFRLIEKRFA
jgi:hypothetical protein